MFNLIKKDKEKDAGRKKDKKDKRERMSAAELRSLDEMSMRRGFFNLNRSSKRDSRNKLEISNPIPIKVASSMELTLNDIESDGFSNRSSVVLDLEQLSAASSSDDLKGDYGSSVRERAAKFGPLASHSSQMSQIMKRFSFSQRSKEESTSEGSTPSGQNSAAPSPQVENKLMDPERKKSLQQQTAADGKKVRIPEIVEKTFPASLRLPAVVPPPTPEIRELELQRRNTGDFGFSLRRTTMLDRAADGSVYRRVVHFAEPGAGTKDLALGLVPGDRLVEINGRNVESKSRDEIVEMIRQSGDSVRLKVQPILELSELSRCWLRNTDGLRRDALDTNLQPPRANVGAWPHEQKKKQQLLLREWSSVKQSRAERRGATLAQRNQHRGVEVKEETKAVPKSSDSNGSLQSRSQSVPSLDPAKVLLRTKSPPSAQEPPGHAPSQPRERLKSPSPTRNRFSIIKNPEPSSIQERFKSPEPRQDLQSREPVTNGESKTKASVASNTITTGNACQPENVVKVVKRVVKRVEPVHEDNAAASTIAPFSQTSNAPPKSASEPPKSMPASVPKVTKMPMFSFKHDSVKKEEKDAISTGLSSLMSRGRSRVLRPRPCKEEKQEHKKEVFNEDKESSETTERSVQKPEASESMHPKPEENTMPSSPPTSPATSSSVNSPVTPPAGFIHAPKRVPVPKPSTMVPPAGFIPKATEVLKTPTVSPPPASIPDPKPASAVPKPVPVTPEIPPVLPPVKSTIILCPGFTPTHKPLATNSLKLEPVQTSASVSTSTSTQVQDEKPVSSLSLAAVCSRAVCFSGQVEEDAVAILQAAHAAAAQPKVKTEEQIAAEQAWYGSEKVWLVHKDGFSLATMLKTEAGSLPEGKVKIRLEHDGTVLDVDEDDVEKANPPSFDRSEDLATLLYLNESSVMHCLRQRYGGNLIHTYAGPSIVVINPISAPSMYSEKVMHMFKGCRREDTAPHIYAVAQSAYRNLLTTRQDQSIVLLGKTGSGKTTNCQHLVQYLLSIAGSTGKIFSAEKWQAVNTILEAFGNCATSMNSNASRFSQIVSLDFDQTGQVASASIQTMLLEKLRVAKRPGAESTYNIFYYMMAGADNTLRTELHFNHFAENNTFGIMPHSKSEDKQKAAQQFTKLQAAMKVLGVTADEQKALWLILGAIYHLGAAGATKAGRKQFARHEWAQKAAYLLGCTLEELSSSIFKHHPKGTLQRSTSFRQGPDDIGGGESPGTKITALECLEAMAAGLYGELFTLVISLINRALKSSQHSLCSLLIVDTPGFQNPRLAKRGATFEELCHNYAQERLQALFQERTFVQELERYKEENIELALDDIEPSTSLSVAAIDQASTQALVRTLARTDEARGLLWLMEEEALQPGGSEASLLERLFSYYGPTEGEGTGPKLLLKSEKQHHFLLGHSHGTDWVEYDVLGWLCHAKQNPASQNAVTLLQDSQKKNISGLFMGRSGGATVLSGSIAGLEGGSQLALRRATSMRKTFTTGMAAVKKRSLCIQIKLQVDALIDTVRRSKVHFIHCLLPKAEALSGELRVHGESCDTGLMQLDLVLLRAQLRGSKLLDALRIYRQGYPDHMVFSEFRRRFDAVEELLEFLELEKSSYHMGLSRVFFRAGVLAKLEEQRDLQTRRNITLFQATCRGYLARQAFKKRKIQDLAIRCIQKNIKKNRGVKDWPWWKVFTTVRPLIQVQLSEEQIRGKDEEIQQLKLKVEKVEKERNELRLNTDRLESRITELSSELADERNTGESASQLLESETSERLRFEKDMKDLQAKYDSMKKQMESMEMEVMETRLIHASELNGEMDDDDAGKWHHFERKALERGEWRLKYERAVREIEFTKKRLQQEFDDKLEVEQQNKRQLERRLTDMQADNEEVQRVMQQLKKKCQKLTAELQDTKLHLEGQQSRNHELEKKQRKFDSEQTQSQEEVQKERSQREKLSREKDVLTGEVFSVRQQLEDKDLEMCALNLKLEQMEAELQDLNSQESKDEASLAKVKKQLRDLEAKVKDQEEELDEQAGTIQMLEQAKLRLEMEMERLRHTHSKEIESKDDEVEEIRQSCSKKLKQMEVQLEEEYEDKQKVLKERRELEAKLLAAQDQVSHRDVETEKRLRKDLKRTKALLADAQIMLDHLKNNAPSKREIAQLKNQLEESEFTCAAAVKARKAMEVEIEDLHVQMDDISKAKQTLEEQLSRVQREKNDLQSRMEEDQEDMNELMKKHKAAVAQSSQSLAQVSELQSQLEEAMKEKQEVQEKLTALQSQLEFQEQSMVEKSLVSRQEAKIREIETKLEFEKTQVKRLESLVSRLKENLEKLTEERDHRSTSENREKEQNKRLQRQIRDLKEEMGELAKKEAEASRKKHELEMDIESLEAGNQSLQADLKLAFKRIGDLQAAIEDEMESDDNEDLINSLQDMVTKYQKRKNRTEGDSDSCSEVDDRVDGVKSWLSKSKGSAKNLSDDGNLKSSRYAANSDAKEGKEWQDSGKEGKGLDQSRPVSVMSSLSYRKRSNLKDSLGGKGDEGSLFSALKEQDSTLELSSFRKSKAKQPDSRDSYSVNSWRKDDLDDRGSVISQAYSEAASRARKSMDSRWSEIDNKSVVSSVGPSRASWLDDDDVKSSVSTASMLSRHRSMSRLDERQSERGSAVSPSLSCRSPGSVSQRSPGSVSRADSRMSVARSCRLSEFDMEDDSMSVAYSELNSKSYSSNHSSSGRSMSMPPRARTTDSDLPDASDLKPVSHRNYLDPDLEAAINEVLNFKPVKFKRSSLEDSEAETGKQSNCRNEEEDEVKSVRSGRDSSRSSSSLRRSASAADVHRSSSSLSTRSRKKSKSRKKRSHSSDSSENERRRRRSKKKGKKKKSKKELSSSSSSSSSESQTSSESDSSSGTSTISYKSANSIKRAPGRQASASEDEREPGGSTEAAPPISKKQEKKRKKNVDSVMMKYLYRADSD
ncbi:unconventional myosin-XVIIIa isoform X1 [Silurus asotus]|uniref:Unconventional myosin-XVIIIa isoform X1 n=1 Tax=Silurus asotus TaxID=30991 RepID=A0AAD5B135_SILAS|nr:unconventional myosin-XVIIIa isoform X1 [Silurus asotus]